MKVNRTFKISRVLGSMKKSVGTATTAGLSSVVGRWCKIFAPATTIRCDDVACNRIQHDAKILRRNQRASRRVHQLLGMADRGVAKCVAPSRDRAEIHGGAYTWRREPRIFSVQYPTSGEVSVSVGGSGVVKICRVIRTQLNQLVYENVYIITILLRK